MTIKALKLSSLTIMLILLVGVVCYGQSSSIPNDFVPGGSTERFDITAQTSINITPGIGKLRTPESAYVIRLAHLDYKYKPDVTVQQLSNSSMSSNPISFTDYSWHVLLYSTQSNSEVSNSLHISNNGVEKVSVDVGLAPVELPQNIYLSDLPDDPILFLWSNSLNNNSNGYTRATSWFILIDQAASISAILSTMNSANTQINTNLDITQYYFSPNSSWSLFGAQNFYSQTAPIPAQLFKFPSPGSWALYQVDTNAQFLGNLVLKYEYLDTNLQPLKITINPHK